MRLTGRLVSVTEVTAIQRDTMFQLMERHYAGVRRDDFEADFAEKQWVIQVLDPASGALCGFSTQMLLNVVAASRPVKALFSGDTIIDRDHWGDNALVHVWGRLALRLIDSFSSGELLRLQAEAARTGGDLPTRSRQ
jgi:hypothetical protein